MDVFDDEIVRILLYMDSNMEKDRCIHIFIIKSPKVLNQEPVI